MSTATRSRPLGPSRVGVATESLSTGTRISTALAVLVAQMGMAIAAVLNGLFQQGLQTTSSQSTWIADVFLVPVTLLELSFGVLGDMFGRRNLLIGWAAALSTGAFLSPLFGGLVTRISWGSDPTAVWRWAFVLVGVLAVLSTVVAFFAQNCSAPEGRSLDIPGQVTIAVELFALLYAVIQGATSGWSNPLILTAFVVAAVFFTLFVIAERWSPAPLLRLQLFTSRAFSVNSIITVIGMFAYVGTAYSVSIRLTTIQAFSPLRSAYAFVLLQGFALVLAPVVARMVQQYNPRWALGAGFGLIGVGDLWFSALSAGDRSVG